MIRSAPPGLLAAALLLAGGLPARAATLRDRQDEHLRQLAKRERTPWAHWHLAEAQRLAPEVPGSIDRVVAAARRLAANGTVPWIQGEALGTLASLEQAESAVRARQHVRAAGVLDRGLVLGPLAGPGPGETPPPLAPDDPSFRVTGKRGETGWRAFRDATLYGPLQLPDLLDAGGDVHAFVAFDLAAAAATDVLVVLGSNGPLAAWLDGEPLVERDGERELSDWQVSRPVRLAAGRHRLVVRAGHRSAPPRLLARILDRRGRLPEGVTILDVDPSGALATFAPSEALPLPLPLLGGDDPALSGRLALLGEGEAPDRRVAARRLEEALRRDPRDAETLRLLARAESRDPDRSRRAWAEALDAAGGNDAEALAALLAAARSQGLDALADGLSRRLEAVDPECPDGIADRGERTADLADARIALARLPDGGAWDRHAPLLLLRARLLEAAGRPLEAAHVRAAASVHAGVDLEVTREAVFGALRGGDVARASEVALDALARRPYAVGLRTALARTALARDGPAAALAVLDEGLPFHDGSPALHAARAEALLQSGDRTAALAAFDRALLLSPQDRDLADRRRAVAREEDLAIAAAHPLDRVLEGADRRPAVEGARSLLDRLVVTVHPSGLATRVHQIVLRLDDARAAGELSEMRFAWTPGEERLEVALAEVRRPDGRRVRADQVFDHRPTGRTGGVYSLDAFRIVRFSRLEPGDVVHVVLREDEVGERNLFGAFFGLVVPLSSALPKDRVEVEIDAPASRPLFAHAQGLPEPVRTTTGDRQRLVFRGRLAPIDPEPRMPGWGDVAAWVNVSTYEGWDDMARWYAELVRPQLDLGPALEETAAKLVAGAEDERDVVRRIHAFVLRSTRYVGIEFGIHGFKPYRVSQVVQRGYGDCKDKAALLVALLRAVGVDARFVLVRTRDQGRLAPRPATLWAFNHAIAYVPSLDLFLDGTAEFAGMGELPALDQGAMALVLDVFGGDPAPALVTIPYAPASESHVRSEGRLAVDGRGDAAGRLVTTVTGSDAPRWRAGFQEAGRRTEVLADLVGRSHPGAELGSAAFSGLDAPGEAVVLDAEITFPGLAGAAAGRLDVPVALDPDEHLRDLAGLPARRHDLVLDHPFSESADLLLAGPPGSRPDRVPPPTRLESRFGRFSLEVVPAAIPADPGEATAGASTRTGGGLATAVRVLEELVVSTPRVSPEDYPAFRAFLASVALARRARVGFALDAPTFEGQPPPAAPRSP